MPRLRFTPPRAPSRSRAGPLALAGVLLGAAAAPLVAAPAAPGPVVLVTGGAIRGRLLPDSRGAVFRGIPFARPPVGDLRWREPMPVAAWTGIREAAESGPPAAQPPLGWNDRSAAASREDCLYLDVWTPASAPGARNPVMVWIHGGANVAGAGGFDPLYDGGALVSHGVVLVVIEYRLGIFGFLAHPELARESPHHTSGNFAIQDQIAALQWVRANIAAFGGDPSNVTIFGQSAGSFDVTALMASPLAKGLFQRAIGESGAMDPPHVETRDAAERAGIRAAARMGAPDRDALRFLRSLPTAEVLKAGESVVSFCADGWVFPESPLRTWASGREHPVPLIIGSNTVEFPSSGTPDDIRRDIRAAFGDLAPRALALYGLAGGDRPVFVDPVYGSLADQWGSDQFRCPVVVDGQWHSRAGNPVWEFEFNRAIPPRPRVGHSSDLPYVFGNLYATGSQGGAFTDEDRALSAIIQGYWTNFARSGDPNGPGLPPWPRYDPVGRRYIVFTPPAGPFPAVAEGRDERGPFCDLFRQMMERSAAAP